jgi:uncharacterized protein (DUF488 family)
MTAEPQDGSGSFTVYTAGHGDRASDELIALLRGAGVERLADVRAHPGSRRHPQFSRQALEHELNRAGIVYVWEGEALGGRRRPRPQTRHPALRNRSFRAYADHMDTGDFVTAMARLMAEAARDTTAILCAERLPWQCHRYLIADYLVAHGVSVLHLIAAGAVRKHTLHPAARLEGGAVIYDRLEERDSSADEHRPEA